MRDVIGTVALLSGLFLACFAIAQWLTGRKNASTRNLEIARDARVRILGPRGAHFCHYVRQESNGLVFLAPLSQDSYVPIRPGDSWMVQVPDAGGVTCFRSSVVSRNAFTHEFTLSLPTTVRRVDRRTEPRDRNCAGACVKVNGAEGKLVDVSTMGACVRTQASIETGDLIWLELPEELGQAQGWALEVRQSSMGNKRAVEIRIAFAKAVEALKPGMKFHAPDAWAEVPLR